LICDTTAAPFAHTLGVILLAGNMQAGHIPDNDWRDAKLWSTFGLIASIFLWTTLFLGWRILE
jgi:hypothetical protein